jgi:DNA-binding NtrC family response regulator
LLDYLWPGNVRELENCIEYALAMAADQVISLKDLPLPATAEGKPNDANLYLQSNGNPSLDSGLHYGITDNKKIMSKLTTQLVEAEKEAISSALHRYKGNRTLAARELGISRTTLWRKITMYHLNQ